MTRVVNFTGMDGSGKTTALRSFARIMRHRGYAVLDTPPIYFDTALHEYIERFEHATGAAGRMLERYVHTVDMAMILRSLSHIDPTRFDFILFDRHFLDKRVFYELRTGVEWPPFFESLVVTALYPDINLFFRVDPHVAYRRLTQRRAAVDWKESLEVLTRSPAVYEKYLDRDSATRIDIDASLSENLVINQVLTKLAGFSFD